MEIKNIKQKARNLIDKLPDNSTWDDLMYEIYMRQAIEAGLGDSEAGKVISVAEVRTKFIYHPSTTTYHKTPLNMLKDWLKD
ncbi:MAG: hypothetical protein GPJ15_08610 [Microcystis aeruginosa G11-06]|nr:hypothetical protein [Microcystis aeruginosa G11-06]